MQYPRQCRRSDMASAEQDKEPTVYLDHLIHRESLRYQQRRYAKASDTTDRNDRLSLISLAPSDKPDTDFLVGQLRKPDFQRATLSWTANDCVLLLESFVKRLVVPGIVIWSSPYSSYHYILDGAHRVSVVMAWLRDDWGDKVPAFEWKSVKQEKRHKEAAKEVRDHVREQIGFINDFKADYEEFQRIEKLDGKFERMGEWRFQRANFYRDYVFGKVGFRIH